MSDITKFEINDDQLEDVVGGYEIGTTVHVRSTQIRYCSNCGRLLMDYYGKIVRVNGVLDGNTIYTVSLNCCGHKTRINGRSS